jgi:hypothetical protein
MAVLFNGSRIIPMKSLLGASPAAPVTYIKPFNGALARSSDYLPVSMSVHP